MTVLSAHQLPERTAPTSNRTAVLSALVSIAAKQVAGQLDTFASRLSEALLKLSEHGVRTSDGEVSLHAFQHLSKNRITFHRLVSTCLTELLSQEIGAMNSPDQSKLEREAMDLSLVTFEAMERKVLIDNLSQALENADSETLNALNLRVAKLLQRAEIETRQNPFRPEIFLKAIDEAWCRFDLNAASHLVVLRQMRPEIFLDLEPVLQALNEALIAQGILPNLADAWRLKKSGGNAQRPADKDRRNPLHGKLYRWLSPPLDASGQPPEDSGMAVHPGLFVYLTNLQKQALYRNASDTQIPVTPSASLLRQIKARAPRGSLTQVDGNAIELLAKIFDHLFSEQHIPRNIKSLLDQLQIPLLKAVLADKDFFFREAHPARRLLEAVARSSVACDQQKGNDDPLYKMIEQIVERVQQEYDQQIELFDDVANDLESYLAQESEASDNALSQAIAEATRQERIKRAKELAENDVASRIETGEVAGFVEVFLETQWTRILGLAYTVVDTKPEALPSALKTMDDLIWSVKPKTSPEERKQLLSKLPSLLSMLNAWLSAVKWDGPDRVAFFSTLAERHAAIVRTAVELSPRHQLEMTMNAAQKASERRLNKRASADAPQTIDDYVHLVDGLEAGAWIEFVRNGGESMKARLAWITPQRSRFVFTHRQGQGQGPFTLKFEELAQAFRDQRATVVAAESVIDRALAAAMEEM